MATPSLGQVTKVFAIGVEAVSSLDLTLEEGESVVLAGPSAVARQPRCGWATGPQDVPLGTIRPDGKSVNDLSAR